jgi:acyl dehydratase
MKEMSPDQWHKTIDEYLVKTNERAGQGNPAPREHLNVFSFPLCHREVTEDLIRIFCAGIGNPNPLYTDPDYAKASRWGGMIAPPHFENRISEGPSQPPPCPVPGYNAWLGGGEPISRGYFRPFRPGDVIDAQDEFLGIEEITDPNEPFRKFRQETRRTYFDQKEEAVCLMVGRVLFVATPPDKAMEARKSLYEDRERKRFSQEELDAIHQGYEEELAGKWRRGAEVRYWEDVKVGDALHPIVNGPYDISDAVAYIGNTGYMSAYAVKWSRIKNDTARMPRDPDTGEVHHIIDWRLSDAVAQGTGGSPYAQAFGLGLECSLGHSITNWMGDDAFLKKTDVWMDGCVFHGEVLTIEGVVAGKRVEDGEHLVDLELTMTTNNGHVFQKATATVRLLSRSA